MGPFTINLWERANATDQEGDLFQYIFSHSAYANRTQFAPVDAFHPNQVYIPADCTASFSTSDACDYHQAIFMAQESGFCETQGVED